jgi:hypothetical protein
MYRANPVWGYDWTEITVISQVFLHLFIAVLLPAVLWLPFFNAVTLFMFDM